jgi:apolipoprotein N-acyltransferase
VTIVFYPTVLWIALGALSATALPGLGCWPLLTVGLAPLYATLFAKHPSKTLGRQSTSWAFGYGAVAWSWLLRLYPLDWLGLSDWQGLLVTIGAFSLGVLYHGGWFVISMLGLRWLWRQVKSVIPMQFVGLTFIVLTTAWGMASTIILEATPLGLPFTRFSLALAHLPVVRCFLLPYWGSVGVVGVIIAMNACVAICKVTKVRCLLLALFISLLALPIPQPANHVLPMTVIPIQGNLSIATIRNTKRLTLASIQGYLQPLRLQIKNLNKQSVIFVLPEEGAVVGWVNATNPEQNPSFSALQQLANQHKVGILVGVALQAHCKFYNAMACLKANQAPQFYLKRHLVPFGEGVPGLPQSLAKRLLSPLGLDSIAQFSQGIAKPRLLLMGKARIGPLVCLELLDTRFAMAYKRQGANLLVVGGNLGWFQQGGGNSLLEAQFKALAYELSATTGLPVVLASNQGPSGVF